MPFIVPIITSIAAAATTIGTAIAVAGPIVQGLVMAGIGVAASFLLNKLMPQPGANNNVPTGVQFERQYGTSIARQVPVGLVGLAGHDTNINTYGPANGLLQQVYTLSDFYSHALSRAWAGGDPISTDKGWPLTAAMGVATVTSGDFAGKITIQFFDGFQTSAPPGLTENSNPTGRWLATDVGFGQSFVVISMGYDQDKNNSFPDFFFELMGALLYDWRKDDTVGGSGAHRWGDPTTYEFTQNPIVQAYNYRRGFVVYGDMFLGMGMPASDLPVIKWTTAAAICDEALPEDLSARYICSAILSADAQHNENLQSLSLACGSMDIDTIDGSWPLVGSDQPIVMTITDDDIVYTGGQFKRTEKRSMGVLVNSVAGNYPEPDLQWSMIGYDPQTNGDFLTLDRRTRDIGMDFPMVPNGRRANNLANIYLLENRYEAVATITLRPRFRVLETGDWISWASDVFGTKTFLIKSKSLLSLNSDKPRCVVLEIEERDGGIYNGAVPPVLNVRLPPGTPVYMAEVEDFAAIAIDVTGDDGTARPGIRASWLPIDDPTIVQVEIRYYPVAQGVGTAIYKTFDAVRTVAILNEGIVGNTVYEVQARVIANPSRTTVFNAGVEVTTLDTGGLGFADLDKSIQEQITSVEALFRDDLQTFKDKVGSVLAQLGGAGFMGEKDLRSQLNATSERAFVQIETLQTVVANDEVAFAQYQVTVSAQFDGLTATITEQATVIADVSGYVAANYSLMLDVNGYAIGFQVFNGGPGISATIFTVDKFQIAFPGHSGGAAVPIFTLGNVGGVAKIGLRGDMIIDGTITGQMIIAGTIQGIHIAANQLTATHIQAGSIDATRLTAGTISSASGVITHLGVQSESIGDFAVTVPVAQTLASNFTGNGGVQNYFNFNISIDTTGLSGKTIPVYVNLSAKWINTAPSGTQASDFGLYINGIGVDGYSQALSGAGTLALVILSGAINITGTGGVVTVPVVANFDGSGLTYMQAGATCYAQAAKR